MHDGLHSKALKPKVQLYVKLLEKNKHTRPPYQDYYAAYSRASCL